MRAIASLLRAAVAAFAVAAVIHAYRQKQPAGRFANVPYDFRFPTIERFKSRFWNPEDPRVFTPNVFGVGWSINAYQLLKAVREAQHCGRSLDEPEGPGHDDS